MPLYMSIRDRDQEGGGMPEGRALLQMGNPARDLTKQTRKCHNMNTPRYTTGGKGTL